MPMNQTRKFLTIFLIFTLPIMLCSSKAANPPPCMAVTSLPDNHGSIDRAKIIRRNTYYKTTITANSYHYYCLLGQEQDGDITVKITSPKNLSISFQLFDKDGTLCPPSNYIFNPADHNLQINYHIKANQSYLLGLYNSMRTSSAYNICYEDSDTPTKQTPTSKPTKLPTKTAKPKQRPASAKTSKPKKEVSPAKTPRPKQGTSPAKTPRPKQGASPAKTPRPKQKITRHNKSIPAPQCKLSHTFLQIKTGQSFSIQASITPKQSCRLQWSISPTSLIQKRKIKKTAAGETLYATAVREGTIIITCKVKGSKASSASCTVKIKRNKIN